MAGSKLGGGASFGGSAVPTVAGFDADTNADINVTPMIDVMLVLLIIFMVVTPALAGYTAVLPKARTAAPEKEDRVTLGIDRQGVYYIEGKEVLKVSDEQLTQKLVEAYASRPGDHILYLKADEEVGYDRILTAIDHARNAGVRRIGAITEVPRAAPQKN